MEAAGVGPPRDGVRDGGGDGNVRQRDGGALPGRKEAGGRGRRRLAAGEGGGWRPGKKVAGDGGGRRLQPGKKEAGGVAGRRLAVGSRVGVGGHDAAHGMLFLFRAEGKYDRPFVRKIASRLYIGPMLTEYYFVDSHRIYIGQIHTTTGGSYPQPPYRSIASRSVRF